MSFTSYQSSFYMRDYYRKALLVLMREKLMVGNSIPVKYIYSTIATSKTH